jgi:hypothetical protein
MKTALQIILAKIMRAMNFHRFHASKTGNEFSKIPDNRYGS